ncbi:hypothetical protein CRG98_037472 [Punica granatum]|uniref:CCHC-type domain-containing protein n=1 Tax=Punica granatum TaxID=22663 RepID=A0A2I0IEN9_PUNGR|nr:hypothetical protein CRG98_037472 [Punica granatum]
MLRTTEHDISKGKSILMVQGTKRKGKGKSKGKRAKGASKYDLGSLKPKAKVVKDNYCFHCGNTGHWKQNCKVYLDELKKKKGKQVPQGVVAQSSAQVTQESRRSSRIRHEPERYGFLVTQNNNVLLIDNDESTTYAKAVIGHDSEKWLEAMRSEMESMYTNQVWTLVDPPEGAKPIGCEEELVVRGYTDASFQIDKDDSRSQSGYVFCLNGGAVSWKSSKQETVADSTTEAEYIVASNATKEAVWIKKFVTELAVAKEPRSHQRSKHILRRFHLIREIIDRGDVKICRIPTDENLADPLMKPLVQHKHEAHTRSIGIRQMPDWL